MDKGLSFIITTAMLLIQSFVISKQVLQLSQSYETMYSTNDYISSAAPQSICPIQMLFWLIPDAKIFHELAFDILPSFDSQRDKYVVNHWGDQWA